MKQLLLLVFISSQSLVAQQNALLVPFLNNGLWGIMDVDKTILVCPQFEEAYPPKNGMIRVKQAGKYGFIDQSGNIAIKIKYDEASDFQHGIAKVRKGKKEWSIKTDGTKHEGIIAICGTHYCMRPRIRETLVLYQEDGKYGFTHENLYILDTIHDVKIPDTFPAIFDTLIPITHQLMYVVKNGKGGFMHEGSIRGPALRIQSSLTFEYDDIHLFDCGFCHEGLNDIFAVKKNDRWGYARDIFHPNVFIETKYLTVASLADGFAWVEYETDKFGYIDRRGNEYFIR